MNNLKIMWTFSSIKGFVHDLLSPSYLIVILYNLQIFEDNNIDCFGL